MRYILIVLAILPLLTSCVTIIENMENRSNNFTEEYDGFKKTKNYSKTFTFLYNREYSKIRKKSTFKKSIDSNEVTNYYVIEVLYLDKASFQLDNFVLLKLDQEYIKIPLIRHESSSHSIIHEETSMLNANNEITTTSVVTGYSQENIILEKITYQLDDESISKLMLAKNMEIIYYSGPEMIVSGVEPQLLKTIKNFLSAT